MSNTIADRIKKEANDLIKNLYGPDVEKMRRQLIAFNAKAMSVAVGGDSFVDPILLKLIASKYTTLIVVGVTTGLLTGAFFVGRML